MPRNLVLVVEDDAFVRDDAVTLLEETGADVVELGSADEALSYLVEHADEVAAVFTDVQTPGALDGLQLARSIKSTWPGIMVLVTSGQIDQPDDMPDTIRFLAKPWRPLDVLTTVAQAA